MAARSQAGHNGNIPLVHCMFVHYNFCQSYSGQSTYLEFLERTDNAIIMNRCDDCVSGAIDVSDTPVPFGDIYHSVAHVSHFTTSKDLTTNFGL